MRNEALFDRMAVGNRIRLEQFSNIWILIIECCEIYLIEILNGGIDVAIKDVVTFELNILLHGL